MLQLRIATVAVLFYVTPAIAQAQLDLPSTRLLATREGLQDLATQLELSARSPAYSQELRALAAREAQLIRQRLEEGDLKVGERIRLVVEGESSLTDTFAVGAGPVLTLPVIGDISLRGVLRSELDAHLTREIGRFVRDPVVHAQALIRVSLFGAVTRPGFYFVPTEMLLGNALMLAGGPTPSAEVAKIRVERNGEPIWSGESLQAGITEGRTLEQLNLQAGDQIIVPDGGGIFSGGVVRFALFTLPPVAVALSRLAR